MATQPMDAVPDGLAREIGRIIEGDHEDLVALCLNLGNCVDHPGHEREVGTAVVEWLNAADIPAFLQQLSETSVNAIGYLEGTGDRSTGARSLILNAHMDTQGARPPGDAEAVRKLRGAWVEDGMLYGVGLANDKAQLAAEMIACRSIKKAGIQLQETLFVTGVAQECSGPVDAGDAQARWSGVGPKYAQVREGAGARWLVEHGIVADFALVGEVSNFCVTTAQAGYLRLRIAVPGLVVYTPFNRRGTTPASTLNPYARAAHVIHALEAWAARYEKEHRFEFWGGVIDPRAQIHEVQGSGPLYTTPVDHCYIFLDIRLAPGASAAAIMGEVRAVLAPVGIDCKISAYDYRRGFVAEGAESLLEAVRKAHQTVLGTKLDYAVSHQLSAWRDGNAFNEAGIPAIGYGPPTQIRQMGTGTAGELRPIAVEDLVAAAKVFALTALSICGVAKAN